MTSTASPSPPASPRSPSRRCRDSAEDLEAFRRRCATWFAASGRRRDSAPNRSREPGAYVAAARENQHALSTAGLAGITWPTDYGGLGLGPEYRQAFDAESVGFETFSDVFTIGFGMCGPVLLALGTEDQRQRYLPPMLAADEVWCQLFSEPGTPTRSRCGWTTSSRRGRRRGGYLDDRAVP